MLWSHPVATGKNQARRAAGIPMASAQSRAFQPFGDPGQEPDIVVSKGWHAGSTGRKRACCRCLYVNQWNVTQDLSQEISCANDEAALFAVLARATATMRFDHFALAYDRRGLTDPGSLLVHNYPEGWATVYNGFDLGKADPIRRAGERALTGFSWHELEHYVPLTKGDRQMLAVGRENGLVDGYTVPRHLVGEASGTCTFVIRHERDLPPDMRHCAEIVGATALAAARRISGARPVDPRPVLSERQRECVLWSARGKTAGEIAAILGISEETVTQHLKNARERYDVHGRQMLVLCAMFDGVIGFSDVFDWWTPA